MSPLDPLLIMIGMGGIAFILYAFTSIKLVKGPARIIATSTLMLLLVLMGNQLLAPSQPEEADQPWFEDLFTNILTPSLTTAQTGWQDVQFEALDLMLSQGLVGDTVPPVAPSQPPIQPSIQPSVQAPVQPSVQAPSPLPPSPILPSPVQPSPVQPTHVQPNQIQPSPQPSPVQPSPVPPSPIPSPVPDFNPNDNQPTPYPDTAPYDSPDQSEPVPAWW